MSRTTNAWILSVLSTTVIVACQGDDGGQTSLSGNDSNDSTSGSGPTTSPTSTTSDPSGGTDTPNPCEDGAQNGAETDVDCGGGLCEDCSDGQACKVHTDCMSGLCVEFTCVPASCTDMVHNGMETDVDCGGPDCDPCGPEGACEIDDDCITKSCEANVCTKQCEDDSACTMLDGPCSKGVCNANAFFCESEPINESMSCDDGSMCTSATTCSAGECSGGTSVDCSLLDGLCQEGVCNPNNGKCEIQPADEGMPCDDLDPCTFTAMCIGGMCTDPNGTTVFFEEDFSDNNAGWLLGPKWEIGAAQQSPMGGAGTGTDPATDHSAGNDNGVAGVVIGGLTSGAQPWTYMYSPDIPLDGIAGPVQLSLWRWLNSDVAAVMPSTIQVYDGAMWQTLWTNEAMVIADEEWTEMVFDVTDHKNAMFRIRIGYQAMASAADVGGWNVDDVRLGVPGCP